MYGVFAEVSGYGPLRTTQTMTETAPESVTDVGRTQPIEPTDPVTDIDTPGLVYHNRRSHESCSCIDIGQSRHQSRHQCQRKVKIAIHFCNNV